MFPDLSEAKAKAVEALALAGKEGSDPLKDLGFVILPNSITSDDVSSTSGQYLNAADKYADTQPEMARVGILGPDCRFKPKSTVHLSFSAGLTEESLSIAQEVCESLKPLLPAPTESGFYLPTMSPFFFNPTEPTNNWMYVPGPKDVELVALVALTPVFVNIIPGTHQWDSLTTDGGANEMKRQTPYLLSSKFSAELDTFPECKLGLKAGQVLVIRRGTPIRLSGAMVQEDDEEEETESSFMVKTVVLELLKKNSRRKSQYAQAIANGGSFTAGSFNEEFPCTLLAKQTEEVNKESILFEDLADPSSVAYFVGKAPKAKAPAAPKADAPPTPAPATAPKAVAPKEESSSSSLEASSSSESPSSSDGDLNTASKKAPVQTIKKALADAFVMHEELRTRIKALDARVWVAKYEENATEKYEKISQSPETASTPLINQYKKALETLTGRVETAEADAKKLAPVLEMCAKIKGMLDEWESLPAEAKDEIRRRKANLKSYLKHTGENVNLVSRAGKIQKIFDKCMDLKKAIEERLTKLSSTTTAVKRARPEVEEVNVLEGIEPVDEDALEPDIRSEQLGDNGWMAVVMQANDVQGKYVTMGQMLANPTVYAYINSFERSYMEIQNELVATNGEPESLDVSKLIAYMDLLEAIFQRNSQNADNKKRAPAKRGTSSRIKCMYCEETRVNFDESGACHECWNTEVLGPEMAHYGNREDALQALVKEERKTIKRDGPMAKRFDEYQTFMEEFHLASEALEKPNAKNLANWKALRDRANKLLPEIEVEDDEFEDEEEEGEDEESEGLRNMIVDSDEEEAHFTGESEQESSSHHKHKHKSLRKREREEPEPSPKAALVSDMAMDVLATLPVQAVHTKVFSLWVDKTKRERLHYYLEDIKENTTTIWGVLLHDLKAEDSAAKTEHDWFLEKQLAEHAASQLGVPGLVKAEVVKRDIAW